MEYQTLYRRWRPRRFDDFVGQRHVVTTLVNAIKSQHVAHAYLVTGPRGTGKTSIAKIFAKALNCEAPEGAEPCDRCSACLRINEGTFLDVLEIDAASNRGVDEIRDLREKVKFTPSEGRYKIYIIDEVHMLTTEAFNALLKTLEEPPHFVVFILATTEIHKIPATILSRCQRFDFKRFTERELAERLAEIAEAEGKQITPVALSLLAAQAEGGMRDAVGLLEQAIAHSQGEITEADVRAILGLVKQEELLRLAQALQERDLKSALAVLHDNSQAGKDLFQFGKSMIEYFREQLLRVASSNEVESLFTIPELIRIIETFVVATNEVKRSLQGILPLEIAVIRLITQSEADLEARITKLEAMLAQGVAFGTQTTGNSLASPQLSAPVKSVATVKEENTLVKPTPVIKGEPAIPVTQVDGTGDFSQWNEFLELAKQRKRTVAALLQEGKPINFANNCLVVAFAPNFKFHLENLSLPHNRELLESVLKELTGTEIRLECVPLTNTSNKSAGKTDLLQKTVELFGGEVRPKED